MKVGFIGLGHMGSGMAASLLRAGHEVIVYNRTREKAQAVAAQGARLAGSVAEACAAGVVVTMLSNDEAVEGVVLGDEGIVKNLPRGGVHVSSSTISVACSERLAAAHADAGQGYVAAPVFGRPDFAASGKLLVIAAGAQPDLERMQALFDAMGRKTFVVSASQPAANLVKLSGNFLIASMIESVGEAIALVEKGGIDGNTYVDIIATLFGSPMYQAYGTIIAERRFEPPGFAAPLGQKDVRLLLQAADDLRVPMPVARLLRERFDQLLATGGEQLDWAAIGGLAALQANVHH